MTGKGKGPTHLTYSAGEVVDDAALQPGIYAHTLLNLSLDDQKNLILRKSNRLVSYLRDFPHRVLRILYSDISRAVILAYTKQDTASTQIHFRAFFTQTNKWSDESTFLDYQFVDPENPNINFTESPAYGYRTPSEEIYQVYLSKRPKITDEQIYATLPYRKETSSGYYAFSEVKYTLTSSQELRIPGNSWYNPGLFTYSGIESYGNASNFANSGTTPTVTAKPESIIFVSGLAPFLKIELDSQSNVLTLTPASIVADSLAVGSFTYELSFYYSHYGKNSGNLRYQGEAIQDHISVRKINQVYSAGVIDCAMYDSRMVYLVQHVQANKLTAIRLLFSGRGIEGKELNSCVASNGGAGVMLNSTGASLPKAISPDRTFLTITENNGISLVRSADNARDTISPPNLTYYNISYSTPLAERTASFAGYVMIPLYRGVRARFIGVTTSATASQELDIDIPTLSDLEHQLERISRNNDYRQLMCFMSSGEIKALHYPSVHPSQSWQNSLPVTTAYSNPYLNFLYVSETGGIIVSRDPQTNTLNIAQETSQYGFLGELVQEPEWKAFVLEVNENTLKLAFDYEDAQNQYPIDGVWLCLNSGTTDTKRWAYFYRELEGDNYYTCSTAEPPSLDGLFDTRQDFRPVMDENFDSLFPDYHKSIDCALSVVIDGKQNKPVVQKYIVNSPHEIDYKLDRTLLFEGTFACAFAHSTAQGAIDWYHNTSETQSAIGLVYTAVARSELGDFIKLKIDDVLVDGTIKQDKAFFSCQQLEATNYARHRINLAARCFSPLPFRNVKILSVLMEILGA